MNNIENRPLVNQQPVVYTMPIQAKPSCKGKCCRKFCKKFKCKKFCNFCKNHPKVLKLFLILYLVFSCIAILVVPFHMTILRIITATIGLKSLKKKSPVLLVALAAMLIQNVIMTFFSAFVGTFGFVGLFHASPKATGLYFVASVFCGIIILICEIVLLVHSIKYFKAEKKRSAPGQPSVVNEDPRDYLEESNPVDPEMPELINVTHSGMPPLVDAVTGSMIQTLPPPPKDAVVQEKIQRPVVNVGSNKYETQITLLKEMGFGDEKKNALLLEKYNGNIQSVIQAYVSKI